MKKIFLLLVAVFLLNTGCGKVEEEGTLYTKDDIFIECIKIDYPEGFTSKLIIIEDEDSLLCAINDYSKLQSMPGFDEIVNNFPVDTYSYVIQFIETEQESEKIICDGIVVDKQSNTIRFKTRRKKKQNYNLGEYGFILYAVFPKEELVNCDFSGLSYVIYPGK